MRTVCFLLALGPAAGLSLACGVQDAPTDESAAQAVEASTRFALAPGTERIKQHTGWPGDLAEIQKKSLDLKNAYWMARLSQLAYRGEAELKSELEAIGLATDAEHFRFFENTCTDTQAFYVSTAPLSAPPATVENPYRNASPDVAVLAFRGTERGNATDIKTDLLAWNRPNVLPAGNVHAGFHGALMSVWEKPSDARCSKSEPIGPFLRQHHVFDSRNARPTRKGAELYVTGHSLGGALATLALTKTAVEQCENEGGRSREEPCFRLYTPVSALITFGAPRTGDRSHGTLLADWMQDRTPIYRFVHGRDGVTNIPSAGWYHPGFDGDDEKTFKVHVGDNPLRMAVADHGERGDGSLVGDHMLPGYLGVLQKLVTGK